MPNLVSRDIPAVILAAGLGSRMTTSSPGPKCLIELHGRPLLSWILQAVSGAGIRRAILVLGNQSSLVEAALRTLPSPVSIRTTTCTDWELGNGRTAAHAASVLDRKERFVLMMSDHLVSASHVAQTLSAADTLSDCCVLATSPTGTHVDTGDATKVLVDDRGFIQRIGKNLSEYNAIDTGVFVMTADLFPALARAQSAGDYSLTGGNRVLAEAGKLLAYGIGDVPWRDLDTPEDLLEAEAAAEKIGRNAETP